MCVMRRQPVLDCDPSYIGWGATIASSLADVVQDSVNDAGGGAMSVVSGATEPVPKKNVSIVAVSIISAEI